MRSDMKPLRSILGVCVTLFVQLASVSGQDAVRLTIDGMGVSSAASSSVVAKIESNASEFLTAVNDAYAKRKLPRFRQTSVSAEAATAVLSIWEMSRFKVTKSQVRERLLKRAKGGWEIRNIPVWIEEASEGEQQQEIVLIFTSDGILDDLYIAVESSRYVELIGSGNDVTDYRRRQIIMDFVETFRTAYNRKDLGYIESVFSDAALIITGKVVQRVNPEVRGTVGGSETVEYQRQSKKEYVDKLRRIFASNSYINIKFSDVNITQHNKYKQMYGVNLLQGWNTSRYSDVGHLMLVIDFSDEDNPLIHVRTWQPNSINGKPLTEAEIFKLQDFKF